MELKDIDVNEPAEASESSPEETEQVEAPAEAPVEQPKEVEEPTEEPAEEPAKPQEESKEEKPLANKTQERIRNLAKENRELKAKMEEFANQPAPELPNGEMTVDDLNRMVNERAMQAAELLTASNRVENEYGSQVKKWAEDFEQVKKDNPSLDPESPDYDADLDSTLARLMDDGNGAPRVDILVSDVLKTINKRESQTASKAEEEGKSKATATLAKQMAESAVTPGNKTSSESEETSDEEMAELRVKNPKEWLKRL
jgi:hypothetical protein